MNILVTGGAGFIGSHVVDAYLREGHEVTVVDNLRTGRRENLNPAATFCQLDIRDAALEPLFAVSRFEVVNHHAALGNVRASMEAPIPYADVNVAGGVHLLECCRKYGTRKIIYSSTGGCVYGEPQYLPADERHPVRPLDPYGASKASFELYLPVYWRNYGLSYTILRYPNVYGPRQDPLGEAGVVSIFAGQMLRGEQPVIFGDGAQVRDFVFVGDVARANVAVLSGGDNDVFNIGSAAPVSVNEIFAELRSITGCDAREVHGPAKPGEVRRSCLDWRRIHRHLAWAPAVGLEQGLRETVAFLRNGGR